MRVNIEFDYCPGIYTDKTYRVEALVELGFTAARGDAPVDVVQLWVFEGYRMPLSVPDEIYDELCEMAIEYATERKAVGA